MMNVLTSNKNNAKSSNWLFGLLFITVLLTAWTAFYDGDLDENDLAMTKEKMTAPNVPVRHEKASFRKIVNRTTDKVLELTSNNTDDLVIPWDKLSRHPLNHAVYNAFNTHSWVVVVPPKKKQKALPPPPPTAPPAPFSFMGKLEDSPKGSQIFLMVDNRLYSVLIGEKINEDWRLDAEDVNALHFTYLPLNLPQIVSKSAKPVEQKPLATAEVAQ